MAVVQMQRGLEGVIAAETSICKIDGRNGELWYRGYSIFDLAEYSNFEEVCFLLLYGKLPTKKEFRQFNKALVRSRPLPKHILREMHTFSPRMSPIEALRTTVSSLPKNEPDLRRTSREHNLRVGIDLIAKFPTIVAAYKRIQQNKKPIAPRADLGHAANLLYMLTGKIPKPIQAESIDTDLILHADHEFNASTFAARVAISTMSDVYSAVVAAISTLRGPHHGGAAQETMVMLREIGKPENARKYVLDRLARHERLMGFGHRVYKTMDPRARILKGMAQKLCTVRRARLLEIQQIMEDTMREQKNLYPNVDFYSATVYHALGFPLSLDTPMFAIGRIPGWIAHILEQAGDNRLIRPASHYTGPLGRKYVPMEKRL